MLDIFDLRLNRSSDAYRRVTAAGFEPKEPIIEYRVDLSGAPIQILLQLKCICGREEELALLFDDQGEFREDLQYTKYLSENFYDWAQHIEDLGAISVEHLREDGYTEEEIKNIRRPYEGLSHAT